MYDNILLPTDGSNVTASAISHAISFTKAYGATLHLLYVVDGVTIGMGANRTIFDELEASGHRHLSQVADIADQAGIQSVVGTVQYGHPHLEILDYGDSHDIDLMVLGTHGRTGLKRYLFRSVTEKVVRLSDIPVLTVKDIEPPAEMKQKLNSIKTDGLAVDRDSSLRSNLN